MVNLCVDLCQFSNTAFASNRRNLMSKLNVNDMLGILSSENFKMKPDCNVDLLRELCLIRDGYLKAELCPEEINDLIRYICNN